MRDPAWRRPRKHVLCKNHVWFGQRRHVNLRMNMYLLRISLLCLCHIQLSADTAHSARCAHCKIEFAGFATGHSWYFHTHTCSDSDLCETVKRNHAISIPRSLIRTCWPPGGADVDRSTAEGRRLGAAAQHVSRPRQKQGAAQWRSAGRGALPPLCCPGVSYGVSSPLSFRTECDDWHPSQTWQDGTLSIEEIQKGIAESAVEIPQDLIEIMPLGKNLTSLLKSENIWRRERHIDHIENNEYENINESFDEMRVFAWLSSLRRPASVLSSLELGCLSGEGWTCCNVAFLFCSCGHLIDLSVSNAECPFCISYAAICSIQYNFKCLSSIGPGLNIHEFRACRLMLIDLHTGFFMTQHFTEPGSTPNPIREVEDWLVEGFGWDLKIREISGIIFKLVIICAPDVSHSSWEECCWRKKKLVW